MNLFQQNGKILLNPNGTGVMYGATCCCGCVGCCTYLITFSGTGFCSCANEILTMPAVDINCASGVNTDDACSGNAVINAGFYLGHLTGQDPTKYYVGLTITCPGDGPGGYVGGGVTVNYGPINNTGCFPSSWSTPVSIIGLGGGGAATGTLSISCKTSESPQEIEEIEEVKEVKEIKEIKELKEHPEISVFDIKQLLKENLERLPLGMQKKVKELQGGCGCNFTPWLKDHKEELLGYIL